MTTPLTAAAAAAETPKLARIERWDTKAFHEFLLERARMPFAWGSNDCALFAADGIRAMTGVDLAAPFRGKYSDEVGALAAIRAIAGGSTVADAAAWCAAQHSLAEWEHPLCARRGDLVIVKDSGREISGLVHLTGAHVAAPGERGLRLLPLADVVRAWHIGPTAHARTSWSADV